MMALSAAGRDAAAAAMLESMQACNAAVVREVALPVCQAVLAHRRGEHERAVALMSPLLGRLPELGGSHAQRDVLHQLFLDASVKARRAEETRRVLELVAARFPVAPGERLGYAEAARSLQ
jgi:hypothetical protein